MAVPWIVVLCRGAIVCLVPLGLYLQTLARRYKGPQPVLISGTVDFLTLLAGLGGFLLGGLALVVGTMPADPRVIGVGDFARFDLAQARGQLAWVGAGLTYVGVVGFLGIATLRRRARVVCLYRVDRTPVETAISEALAAAGVPAERFGDAWASDRPLVEVRHSPALGYSDIRVTAPDTRLAEEITRQLGTTLAKVPPCQTEATGIFSAFSWLAFFGAAVAFGLLVVYEVARRG